MAKMSKFFCSVHFDSNNKCEAFEVPHHNRMYALNVSHSWYDCKCEYGKHAEL